MSKQAWHFEDYEVGSKGMAAISFYSRTVTEADIVNFACLTGDYNRVHLDRHYSASSEHGERVAHGLLGSGLVTGILSSGSPRLIGRGVPGAYLYSFEANYRNAIKLGDTVNLGCDVIEKVADIAHDGYGLVRTAFHLVNQEGNSVYDGTVSILVRKKTAGNIALQLKPGVPRKVTPFIPDSAQVYYAEDDPVGKGGETGGRTITEADIVNFAGLTGDYNPQHVDAEYGKSSLFGERIAHGMLVFSAAYGLWTRLWHMYSRPRSSAGRLNDKITFLSPVKIGDTIRCRYVIESSRISRTRPEAGLVTYAFQVLNQNDEVVQEASTIIMIPSRKSRAS